MDRCPAFTRPLLAGLLGFVVAGCAAPPYQPPPVRDQAVEQRSEQPKDSTLPIVPPGAPPPHATESLSGPTGSGLTKPN